MRFFPIQRMSLHSVLLLALLSDSITSFTLLSNNKKISATSGSSNTFLQNNKKSKRFNNNVVLFSDSSSSSNINIESEEEDESEIITSTTATATTIIKNPNNEIKKQYTSIFPGTTCTIRIDNRNEEDSTTILELSRKAWKKRRRSKSPILIPVSIINTEPTTATSSESSLSSSLTSIRWNIMYLIMKYGEGDSRGLTLRTNKMIMLYERLFHVENMMESVVSEMGYDNVTDLLEALFGDESDDHGVQLVSTSSTLLLYMSSMSRLRGRDLASHTALIQTTLDGKHTGQVQLSPSSSPERQQAGPLSAALRIRNPDAFAEVLSQQQQEETASSITLQAHVLRFDPCGDDGNPLLTLSLTPTTAARNKRVHSVRRPFEIMPTKPKFLLKDLKGSDLNDGQPYNATIVYFSRRSKSAFVDIGVGRLPKSSLTAGAHVRVLGMLRFNDIFPASTSSYSRPIFQCTPDNDDNDEAITLSKNQNIQVYITRVFPQSSRFMVSLTPPSEQTEKPKQIKQQKVASKRLSKLSPYLPIIQKYNNTTCIGIVKAKSKVGVGYYVQPLLEDLDSLVGFAEIHKEEEEESSNDYDLEPGEKVSIRVMGIDQMRGQLCFTLLGKEN